MNKLKVMTRKIKIALLAMFAAFASFAQQPGILDLSYNPTDLGLNTGDGANSNVRASVVQPDGKIIIVGDFTSYNGTTGINRIARLNSNGSIDATFNSGTGANGIVYSVALQNDGKILIGGEFKTINGTSRTRIARLNSDGSLDGAFNPTSGADSTVFSIVLTSAQKVVIGGLFSNVNGVGRNRVALLGSDGSLDLSFDPGTGAGGTNNAVRTCLVDASDKIIISGDFTTYNGTARNRIARININGSNDVTFAPGTAANNIIYTTALQPDGKIIIGGQFTSYAGTTRRRVARINSNGTLDATFNTGVGITDNNVRALALQSDGKIILGGQFTVFNGASINRIVRVSSTGTVDGTFSVGTGASNTILSLNVLSSGKILIGGSFTSYNNFYSNRIGQLNSDGTFDTTFNPSTGANSIVRTIAIQSDGKAIIAGDFTSFNGIVRNRIARVNTDGSIDLSFNPGTGANNIIYSALIQPDGKIIIAGQFTSYNGTTRNRIARLNSDGSLDNSFDPGVGPDNIIFSALLSNGKILIGGQFTTVNGISRNYIAQLNSDGTHDLSFDPGTGASNNVRGIAVNSNGKILAVGDFTSFHGFTNNRIVQLNSDGSIDPSFTSGTAANNIIYSIALQTDDKIVIGGAFTNYNGTGRNRIARLNVNGTLDATFTPSTAANSNVRSIAIQTDGKVIIAGQFTTFAGTSRTRLARLNSNGTLETLFNPGSGANNTILATALQSDGELLIGGQFNSYNGTGRNRLARVIAICTPPSITSVTSASVCGSGSSTLTANSSSGTINWYTAPSGGLSINSGNTFVTPSLSTTTTYYVDATNVCTTNTRTPVSLVVNNLPNISITGPSSVCVGSGIVLTASGGTSYSWTTGANTFTVLVSPTINSSYSVTGFNANGCFNTASKSIAVNSCVGPTFSGGVCGSTLSSIDQTIYWTGVTGATNYRVRIISTTSTFSTVNTRNQGSTTNFKLSWVPGIQYGQSYDMSISAYVNGVWQSYGPTCNVSTTPLNSAPTSSLSPGSCGKSLTSLDELLYFTGVPMATNYRLEISNAAQSFTTVNVRNNTVLNYRMSWITGVQYGRTYNVRISAMINGAWQAYGNMCTVTTPSAIPTTQFAICGNTVPSLTTTVNFNPVVGATKYRLEITPSVGTPTVHVRPNNLTTWALSYQTGTKCGVTYSIRVSAYVGNVWGAYGPPCTLSCSGTQLRILNENGEMNNEEDLQVKLYPNPNNGRFTLDLPEDADVIIMDALGKEVLRHHFNAGKQELELYNVENGIYFINVVGTSSKFNQKIIISK